MSSDIHYRETMYGFEYGAMRIERLASLPSGHVVLSIKTDTREICIVASPQGRRLRVAHDMPLPERERKERKKLREEKEASDVPDPE